MSTALLHQFVYADAKHRIHLMSETLSAAVIEEIHRLGGTLAEAAQPLDLDGIPAPEPVRQFLADVTWPSGVTYSSATSSKSQSYDSWATHITLGYARLFGELDSEEIGMDPDYLEEDGMNMCPWADKFNDIMVQIGLAENGNYLLMLDLEDDDPSDPQIYRLHHNDPDQFFDDLQGDALSGFLKNLQPDS
jgi:hypothetical protein